MKKALFPTDFSENSLSVLAWAAAFCNTTKTELVLFHAMMAPAVPSDGSIVNTQEIIAAQEQAILQKLSKLATNIRSEFNIVVNTKASYGFSAETISGLAKEDNFDLIILSAQGESNFLDKIFGNTTENLFEKSEVPILSIPANLAYSFFDTVAFASSNIDNDAVQIFDLLEILKPCNTKVKLVHVVSGNDFEKETFEDFPNLEYIELGGEDKLEVFSQFVEKENIDLVCVKRYKLPFLYRLLNKSFTKDLFHHIKRPLLVFKDE